MRNETKVAEKLIDVILEKGYEIAVFDECEISVERTRERQVILKELNATGYDVVKGYNENSKFADVSFLLIWGNDSDGSELIADCSSNPPSDQIYNLVYSN